MKKYLVIRILVVFIYIAVLWYGLSRRTDLGYSVIIIGLLAGMIINYINYRVNFKGKFDQKNEKK